MQSKIQTAHLRNQSAEQRARKVLPRRAKITKTQYELFVKVKQQKKEERVKRRDEKHHKQLLAMKTTPTNNYRRSPTILRTESRPPVRIAQGLYSLYAEIRPHRGGPYPRRCVSSQKQA